MRYLTIVSAVFLLNVATASAQEVRSVKALLPIDIQELVNGLRANSQTVTPMFSDKIDFDALNRLPDVSRFDDGALTRIFKPSADVSRRMSALENASAVDELIASAQSGNITAQLEFDLFPDIHLKTRITSITNIADGVLSMVGTVVDDPGSMVTLVKRGSDLDGTIFSAKGQFYVHPVRNSDLAAPFASLMSTHLDLGDTIVDQIRLDPRSQEAEPSPPPLPPGVQHAPAIDKRSSYTPPNIDLSVFYTQKALEGAGDRTLIENVIFNAIAIAKESLVDVKMDFTISLIKGATRWIDFDESGNITTDRDRLSSDPVYDYVRQWRDIDKADVMALIIEDGGKTAQGGVFCGQSSIPKDDKGDPEGAYIMVIRRDCAQRDFSLAHELGHLLGARHDRYVDKIDGPLPANHGIIFESMAVLYRDIMAYQNYCLTEKNQDCPRKAVWSGPVWTFGAPVQEFPDDVDNDVQSSLRHFGPIVANYR